MVWRCHEQVASNEYMIQSKSLLLCNFNEDHHIRFTSIPSEKTKKSKRNSWNAIAYICHPLLATRPRNEKLFRRKIPIQWHVWVHAEEKSTTQLCRDGTWNYQANAHMWNTKNFYGQPSTELCWYLICGQKEWRACRVRKYELALSHVYVYVVEYSMRWKGARCTEWCGCHTEHRICFVAGRTSYIHQKKTLQINCALKRLYFKLFLYGILAKTDGGCPGVFCSSFIPKKES